MLLLDKMYSMAAEVDLEVDDDLAKGQSAFLAFLCLVFMADG
jgi:hypothetical protein